MKTLGNKKILVLADDMETAVVHAGNAERAFPRWRSLFEPEVFASQPRRLKDLSHVLVIVPGFADLSRCDKGSIHYAGSRIKRIALLPNEVEARISRMINNHFSSIAHFLDEKPTVPTVLKKVRNSELCDGMGFTSRESEVLVMIGQGYENTEIAARLGIAPTTLFSHIAKLMNKTGLHSRCQLALFTIMNRLVLL